MKYTGLLSKPNSAYEVLQITRNSYMLLWLEGTLNFYQYTQNNSSGEKSLVIDSVKE